jgi:Tol biopolymer transport system component
MTAELPPLEDLVHAICEGTPVDWDALEATGSETFRSQIAALRVVAGIAEVHRASAGGDAGPAPPMPRRWAHLDVLEPIASGAFGDVYRAWDPQLDREVALKLLRRAPDADAHADEVVEEGRLLARLRHPHIVSVYGAARVDGQVGLWMEYLRGRTLAQTVADDGALPARRVAGIGAALCDALAAVHAAGLVHRDVKAQNVMLAEDGRVVLMDFGAGRDVRHVGLDMAGTPLYLAPEVARGAPASPQSDIFSLGVLLRYAATATYSRDVVPAAADRLAARVLDIARRASAREPGERYASAADCGNGLRQALAPPRVSFTAAAILLALCITLLGVAGTLLRDVPRTAAPVAPDGRVSGLTLRPLWSRRPEGLDVMGRPSRDGRKVPLFDEDLRLRVTNIDLAEPGPPIPVGDASNGLPACEGTWGSLALSPAVDRAVFSCEGADGRGDYELRVIRLDSKSPAQRRLVDGPWSPLEWSSPSHILVEKRTPPRQLALVQAETGVVRPLAALAASVDAASLSPDARWVVFDGPGATPADRHDVFIVAAGGGEPIPIASGAADDLLPSWTPNSRGVLFISDRTGSPGLWLQPLASGRPAGSPQLLSQDLGRVADVWTATPGGQLIYFRQTGLVRTMTVALDDTGRLSGEPAAIATRQFGGTMMASWSPDSRRLAYQTTLTGSRSIALGVLDVGAAHERIVHVPLRWFGNPRWTADGRHVAVRGRDSEDREGVHLVDVETGSAAPLRLSGKGNDALIAFQIGHAADVVVRRPDGFYSLDLATRAERQILADATRMSAFAVSPVDGAIAFVRLEQGGQVLVVARRGVSTDVLRIGPREGFGDVKWSAKGTHLYFTRQPFSEKREERVPTLWRVAAESGQPESLALRIDGLRDLSPSPDGRFLSFTAGWPSREPWIVENFLPAAYRSAP